MAKKKTNSKPPVSKKGTSWNPRSVMLVLGCTLLAAVALETWYVHQPRTTTLTEVITELDNPITPRVPLLVGDKTIEVEIRDDFEERSLGLSGRKELADGHGMLFIFPGEGRPMFWMKQMHFAIDVIWIMDGKVVDISERVPPPTEEAPEVATMISDRPITMALEVPAGWVARNEILLGDSVTLDETDL